MGSLHVGVDMWKELSLLYASLVASTYDRTLQRILILQVLRQHTWSWCTAGDNSIPGN